MEQRDPSEQDFREMRGCLGTMKQVVTAQTRLIDALIHAIKEGERAPAQIRLHTLPQRKVAEIIPIMIQGAGSSCHSLLTLSENPEFPVRDCFPIARSIVEAIINVIYIVALGDVAAARADRHAFQKAFRDMERTSAVGNLTFSLRVHPRPDPKVVPGLSEALEEFTRKSGREATSWTEASIEQRLEAIGKRFGDKVLMPLHMAFFSIYRHASEIIHGTFYGSIFFLYASHLGRRQTPASARYTILNHLLLILMSVVLAVDGLMNAATLAFGTAFFADRADQLFRAISEIPLLKKHLEARPASDETA